MNQNKKKRVVAIKYDENHGVPNVVAKGEGYVAEKILEKGQDNKLYIHEDAKLVENLYKVNLGDDIPPELYEVVAKVLVFVEDIDKRASR